MSPDHAPFAVWERDAWEQRATAYAGALGALTGGRIEVLLDAAGVGAGTRVLDVGTGPGYVAAAAAGRGAEVSAVDQSVSMVDIAAAAGVTAQVAAADALPFADAAFDVVTASYLLNHLADPAAAVAEFARVLVPGGRVAMTVWDRPGRNRVTGLIGDVVTDLGLTGVVPPGPDSTLFADDDAVHDLLAGWHEVRVQRPTWTLRVEPGAWFDAIAEATPRTGAVLAQAGPAERAAARERYVGLARQRYGSPEAETVVLPAAAVLISAIRP